MSRPILVRITTIPLSMRLLLAGQPAYFRSMGFEVVLVSSTGEEDWRGIPDIGSYPVYQIPMARAVSPWKDLRSLIALIRLFRKLRPDIVHSHTPKAGLLAMLAARLSGVKIRMHTVAGLPLMERTGLLHFILVQVERLTYRCATGVYPNSTKLMEYIQEAHFAPVSKLKVIAGGSSNGIDTAYFNRGEALERRSRELRAEAGIAQDDLVFLFIGRIVRDKGIHELVQAFVALADKYAHIHLVLLGSFEDDLDPVDPLVRSLIDRHTRIHTPGFARDVRPWLCAADVLTFPSYREGFPNVPMQAGCFSLPCIVSDINGCNEIIIDGLNGLIVPVKDEKSLRTAMERMLVDQELRAGCSGSARRLITERYEQVVVWESLHAEYRRLLTL